ncbi:MAG: UDP-N-acetylmuramoyl-tripeptide--D-alanyl-D-alanine ligase [Mogibacterium sp.]|nr:UDP-N-acetylmuramoyl-tripeptide--D-alanyl-D-alanine ligase [Mogibacterium sp.]
MMIRALITLLLAIPAFWLALHYNMHMFQLNTYMNNEQRAWLAKNRHLQWILRFAMILGVLRLAVTAVPVTWPAAVTDVLAWMTLVVIILVYRLLREMNSKKPLKFTPRVKRMVGTDIFMCIAIPAVIVILLAAAGAADLSAANLSGLISGWVLFAVGAQLFMDMAANTVNRPIEKGVNDHYINDAKRILKENPDLTIIGVTGSYGKTSVKFYLETLLRQKYKVLVTPESYNTPMGIVITIRKFLKPSHEIFICEMGARYVGEIKEDCDLVHPQHGLITSIGPQHLDTFGSLENIQKTKFELADAVPDGGMLFLNGDNEYIAEELGRRKGSRTLYDSPVLYHSDRTGSGYFASDIKVTNHGTDFTVNTPDGETERFSMKLVGGHNVINVMGAIAVAHEFGIPLSELRIPVRKIQSVPHRMEMKNHGDVTIIDDAFNSNPIGSKAAVETLALMDGMRILITPGMVELGEDEAEYNRKFGTYAADCCDRIFLVGRKHTEPIKEGILSKGFDEKNLEVFDKVEDSISRAYAVKTDKHKYILLENDLPDNY